MLAKTGDEDDADEVVQRTLVRVHRGLPGFRGDSRIRSWVYRIAANVWVDMTRARKRRGAVEGPLVQTMEDTIPSEKAGPEEVVTREEGERILRRFLLELAPRQREAVELVDFQGLEPAEAAEIMEVSGSTARVHLHRARRALRSIILDERPEMAEEYGS